MKITHIIFSFNTGGAETMLVDIANEQVKVAEVNIVIINGIYTKKLLSNVNSSVKIILLNRNAKSKNPFPIIKLNLLLIRLKSDVLHCHNHNIIPLIIPNLRKKSVLTLHKMGIASTYLKKYKKLFSISNSVKNDIKNRTNINSIVVYNGILTSLIRKKENPCFKSILKIIVIGRLEHEIKGQHLLVEALKILKENGLNNFQLDLIGSGNSYQFLRELTNKYELTNHINFLGLKNRDYIYAHLRDYDLLIQPSIKEGFGLTVAEGMAAKIPVLVSNVDGPMEIIENGKYGFYFKAGNVQDLAYQCGKILHLTGSEQQKLMVQNAYSYVVEKFNIKDTAFNYIKNY
jgi:glycosyltransferase involved in cell wall biosynthesis